MSWTELGLLVLPVYRQGIGANEFSLDNLLRIYLLRHWFGIDMEDMIDALAESVSMREFCGLAGNYSERGMAGSLVEFEALLDRFGLTETIDEVSRAALAANEFSLVPGRRSLPRLQPLDANQTKLERLTRYFKSIRAPYEIADIVGFNAIYQAIYPELTVVERRRAETYVEALIEGVAQPDYRSKISAWCDSHGRQPTGVFVRPGPASLGRFRLLPQLRRTSGGSVGFARQSDTPGAFVQRPPR